MLDYNAIFNAIPVDWKEILSEINYNDIDINSITEATASYDQYIIKTLNRNNKLIRKNIGGYEKASICGQNFWRRKYYVDISENFKIAAESTGESRLRFLHFKILHNIFPTNILLHRMVIKNSDQCDYCQEREVVEHL